MRHPYPYKNLRFQKKQKTKKDQLMQKYCQEFANLKKFIHIWLQQIQLLHRPYAFPQMNPFEKTIRRKVLWFRVDWHITMTSPLHAQNNKYYKLRDPIGEVIWMQTTSMTWYGARKLMLSLFVGIFSSGCSTLFDNSFETKSLTKSKHNGTHPICKIWRPSQKTNRCSMERH